MDKTTILKKLRPIELLYLMSQERKDLFDKKKRLYCLLYFFVENGNIKIKNNKFKIKSGKLANTIYEKTFLNFLTMKDYLELNTFIENLTVFNKTLVEYGIYKKEIKLKKFLFWKLANEEIVKTTLYYELQAELNKLQDEEPNVLNVVCPDLELKNNILKFYDLLKNQMQKAYLKDQEEKNKKKENMDMFYSGDEEEAKTNGKPKK